MSENFIKVLVTGDKPLITIIKSVLTEADIKFFIKGEELQDIIGLGGFGTGYNVAAGPMELYVNEEDAESVKQMIEELEQAEFVVEDETPEAE